LTDQLHGHTLSNSSAVFDVFSYGSSPGFKWLWRSNRLQFGGV
jgi:hypothetical protein